MVEFFLSPEGRLQTLVTEHDEGDASFIKRYSKKNPGQIKVIPLGDSGTYLKDELKETFYLQSYHTNLFHKSHAGLLPAVEVELIQVNPNKPKQLEKATEFLYHGLSLKTIDGVTVEKRTQLDTQGALIKFLTTPGCFSFLVKTAYKGSSITIGTFSLVETHDHVFLTGVSGISSHTIKEALPYRKLVYLMNGVDLAAVHVADSKPLRFTSAKEKIVEAYQSIGYEIIQRIDGWRLDLKPEVRDTNQPKRKY